jgi:hypothetical protein
MDYERGIDVMNPNEFYKNDPEKKWKILCCRFIGRQRRLNFFENMKVPCPESIIQKERELVQQAYEQMREACLSDQFYMDTWEHKTKEKT